MRRLSLHDRIIQRHGVEQVSPHRHRPGPRESLSDGQEQLLRQSEAKVRIDDRDLPQCVVVKHIHIQLDRKRAQRPPDRLGSQVRPRLPRRGRRQVLALGQPKIPHLQVAPRVAVNDHRRQAIGQRVRQEVLLGETIHVVEDRDPGLPRLGEVLVGHGRLDLVRHSAAPLLQKPPAEPRIGSEAEVEGLLRDGIAGLGASAVRGLPEPRQRRHSPVPCDGNRPP